VETLKKMMMMMNKELDKSKQVMTTRTFHRLNSKCQLHQTHVIHLYDYT
jgi:hypothetical protein